MLGIIQIVIALGFLSQALAALGDLRIREGGNSGQLEIQSSSGEWNAICDTGFDDDAGDVACRQLGYIKSSDIYSYSYYYIAYGMFICSTYCTGSEDRLTDCLISTNCNCYGDGVVGITCANNVNAGQIYGIVVGMVVFITLIATCVTLCICCLSPTCPCYYRKYHRTRTVAVAAQQTLKVVTATTTNTNAIKYQPLSPVYNPNNCYQPYPTVPPPATTIKY